MAIKIKIEYICDKCGKKHIEKIEVPGYEDVPYFIGDEDGAYMPDGWLCVTQNDDTTFLKCKKCKKEDHFTDGIVT